MKFDKTDIVFKENITIQPDDIWIPADQTVSVAGREICGMIYIGTRVDRQFGKYCDSVIDPTLQVKESTYEAEYGFKLGPKPWGYGSMDYLQRALYLDWLASGRSAEGFHQGYISLFIFGLERRFFIDSPTEEERGLILAEAKRLLEHYRDQYPAITIERQLTKFIHAARAISIPADEIEPRYSDVKIDGEISLDIAFAMKNKIEISQRLNHEWYVVLYLISKKFRAPTLRALPEFLALLKQSFDKNFPDGLTFPKITAEIDPSYESHDQGFTVDLSRHFGKIPDLTSIDKLKEGAVELIDESAKLISPYGRYLGTEKSLYSPLSAYKLIPESIKPFCLPPEFKKLKAMAEEAISSNELIPVIDLLKTLNLDNFYRIYPTEVKKVSKALRILSYGMVPDPLFEWDSPTHDAPYAVFELPKDGTLLTEVSDKYQEAIMCILAGFIVGKERDPIHPSAIELIKRYVQSTQLVKEEKIRLDANLHVMLNCWPTIIWYRNLVKKAPKSICLPSVEMALKIACIDGDVTKDQMKEIKKIYRALKLPVDTIESDLHSVMY